MNEQGAQQQPPPPQQQQQQHEERAILSQLKETDDTHPGTWQAPINAEQPTDVLRNTNTSANDFSSLGRPYELFVPQIQDHASAGPSETENIQPQLNFLAPIPTLDFSQPNTVSNPTNPFPRGNGPRTPHLPRLTLQTANVSPPRPSWQSSISFGMPSQFTSRTPSYGTGFTSFNFTKSPFGTTPSIYPPSGLDLSRAYLDYNKNIRSSEEVIPYQRHQDSVITPEDFERLEDLFADSHPIPSPRINDDIHIAPGLKSDSLGSVPRPINPLRIPQPSTPTAPPALPTQPHLPPSQHQQASNQPNATPYVLNKVRDPRPQASCDNRCPRCNYLFTSKPRDLSRNIRRHLELACPKRNTLVPRLSCSVLGCRKTFVRDCAKRLHEEKEHGIVRHGRHGALSGAIEDSSMRRASSTKNTQEDVVRQTPIQPSVLTKDESASQQEDRPIDSSPIELESSRLHDQALIGNTESEENYTSGRPLFHDSMKFNLSNNVSKGVKAAWGSKSVVDSNARDSGYVSAMNATMAAPVCCDEQELEVEGIYREENIDDAATVVTDGTKLNLPQNTKGYFIQQFAEVLLIEFPPAPVPAGSLDRISKVLPDLLKQYAFRFEKKTQSQDEKDAVAFVRQNRTYIAAALHEKWCEYEESTQRKLFLNEDHAEMSWKERVSQWDNADSADISLSEESLKHLPDAYDEDEAPEIPDISLYKPHLLGGEAYKWLISRLRMEFLLARPEAFAMEQIREAILQQCPRYEKARISFHLDWNPSAFFEAQGYKGNLADELPRAITITGSSTSAQTTSCERYLLDTWPATGALTLKALQRAISETQDDTPASDTLQNSNLRVSLRETHTEVEIMGDKDLITDIGQQFGWIGAALRSSKVDGQMCYCVPSVTYSNGIFTIEYSSELVTSTETILNGNCWHPLFNNPAIVRGFPIATRRTGSPDEELPGLEIPLNMMAGVAEAKRITEIDGRLLIKGFSTLFVPTKRVGDLVIWHMLYNEDDSRISYFDLRGVDISDASVKSLTFSALESCRHILGWCSVAKNLAGSRHAKYDIKTSGLSQPGQGWTFEKVSISGGKIINGGVTFGKGNINTPLRLQRQPVYVKQIYEARFKYVILHDIEDKRAWLLNGADALLHLARAHLTFASKDPLLRTSIKFSFEDLWVPDDEYDACAPFKILCNDKNKDLIIYEEWNKTHEKTIDAKGNVTESTKFQAAHFRFRDQVDDIYHIWEQIQDFQIKMTDNIRLTDRDKLQGFNFIDIATGESLLKPRFTYLERSGRGWVDLARSLDAITLFGRGFGELLRPSSASNKLCHSWSHVPTGKDYLAVSMSDVSAIFDKRGNATSRPMELVDGLFWHKADKLFEPCECADAGSRKRRFILGRGTMCDRVQVLLPPSLGRKVDPGALEEKGAVIFGRSERYRWHWPNQGQPNETTGSDEDSESERPQKKARSSPSSQGSQVSEVFSGDTQQTSATSVSGDASSSSRTETPVKK